MMRLARVVIALVLGVLSLATATWVLMDRCSNLTSIPPRFAVRGGTSVWTLSGADATGIWWRLAQQTSDLRVAQADIEATSGQWDDGVTTGWCLLEPTPWRTASIAVGWPEPWILWRFSAQTSTEAFPPSPEVADEIEGLIRGVDRALQGEGQIAFTPASAGMALLATTLASFAWWLLLRRLPNAKQRNDHVDK
ncbi:MAG: hypothetical protein EXS17_04900 [Phycisphaerales bacterium]|nr:hypothetical protein [Phycisphaerales bacterium]